MLFYSFSVFFNSVCTFSICIGGNKDLLKLVLLHETTDLLHCSFEAGHIISVPPDEVLPTQVDSQVRASLSTAQPVLVQELQKVTQQIWLLCHTEMSVGVNHMANIPEMHCTDMWTKALMKLKSFILFHNTSWHISNSISIMLTAMTPVWTMRGGINASETYFHSGPVSLYGVWSCLSVELRYLALNSSPMTRKCLANTILRRVCRTIK